MKKFILVAFALVAAFAIGSCSKEETDITNTLKYDGKTCNAPEDVRRRITSAGKKEDMLILVDDYAEAHRYKKVLEMLEELKKMGYQYTESMAGTE